MQWLSYTHLFAVSQFGNFSHRLIGLLNESVHTFHGLHDFILILQEVQMNACRKNMQWSMWLHEEQ